MKNLDKTFTAISKSKLRKTKDKSYLFVKTDNLTDWFNSNYETKWHIKPNLFLVDKNNKYCYGFFIPYRMLSIDDKLKYNITTKVIGMMWSTDDRVVINNMDDYTYYVEFKEYIKFSENIPEQWYELRKTPKTYFWENTAISAKKLAKIKDKSELLVDCTNLNKTYLDTVIINLKTNIYSTGMYVPFSELTEKEKLNTIKNKVLLGVFFTGGVTTKWSDTGCIYGYDKRTRPYVIYDNYTENFMLKIRFKDHEEFLKQ